MFSTIDKLDALETEDEACHSEFGVNTEKAVVSVLFDHPQFCELGYIKPDHFSDWHCRYVVASVLNYFGEHGTVPTRDILWDIVSGRITEDDPWEELESIIKRKSDRREVSFVKQRIRDWIKHQAYSRVCSEEIMEALCQGRYEEIVEVVHEAERLFTGDSAEEAFGFVSAEEFLREELDNDWLIDDVMVAHEPFLMGGKKKTLKTGILCDMAISLATGTNFLNKFPVSEPRRVAFFSSESGRRDIQHRLRCIRSNRGIDGDLGNLLLSFERPRLSDDDDLSRIGDFVERREIDVLIVDPLYLTLLTGNSDASGSNLYDMGNVFAGIAGVCERSGTTPVLCHHFKKTVGNELDLDDFAFTGAAEFARQSLLIGRRGKYAGPRNNQLSIRLHGYRCHPVQH